MSREMKDSEIDWIDQIPENWQIVKVNKLFFRRKEINDSNNPTILSLARDGVKVRDISTNEGQLAESYDNYHKVYKNDLMINPMDLISGANCSLSEVEGVISPAYINLANKGECCPKYYDYFFKNQYWVKAMFIHGKGVSFDNRWTMNNETMMGYKIPMPSRKEQTKIANYLDNKCLLIEQQIENNKKSIELLEEYKTNLYDEVCLKGLKNREFNNINHYSISKIPNEWNFDKVLNILEMPITDGPHETPNLIDNGIPFISADSIKNGKIDFSRMRGYISQEDYEEYCKKYIPAINDIYMIKSGATTGKVAMVETNDKFNIWSPLGVFRCNDKMMPKYLYFYYKQIFFKSKCN